MEPVVSERSNLLVHVHPAEVSQEQTGLVLYDSARKALAEARRVDEAKKILDKAVALQVYARQARDREMELLASEIRLRAQRRAGDMLKEMRERGLRADRADGRPEKASYATTLSDLGITRDQSSKWQRIAELSDDAFEAHIESAKRSKSPITTTEVLRNRIQREERRDEIREGLEAVDNRRAKELAGLYDVIVVDPPWPMQRIERDCDSAPRWLDYPVMKIDDIKRTVGDLLAALSVTDSHIFLWTTQKFLPIALHCFETWSIKYVCTFVWHKRGGFQPYELPQYNCEFAIYGRKGSPAFIDTKAFPTCFEAPRGKHSEKPKQFYAMLRRATGGRRLDMFSRRNIDGFDGWGNEYVERDLPPAPEQRARGAGDEYSEVG